MDLTPAEESFVMLLREVGSKMSELNDLDTTISRQIQDVERCLNNMTQLKRRVVQIPIGDGEWLAWTGVKGRAWRFVIRDEFGVEPLLSCARDVRADTASEYMPNLVKLILSESGVSLPGL